MGCVTLRLHAARLFPTRRRTELRQSEPASRTRRRPEIALAQMTGGQSQLHQRAQSHLTDVKPLP
eukprot:3673114-Alexandrium_andersonii.AAC.1